MNEGIIYICSTVVDGLVKIGISGVDKYEGRLAKLERDGYHNVAGLKRQFAIKVNYYEEKENIIKEVLAKSRIANSELYTIGLDSAIKLLSSFEGEPIYPLGKTKNEIFEQATESEKVSEEEAEEKSGRTSMPKYDWLVDNGVLKPGDVVYSKRSPSEKATIVNKEKVDYKGKKMSLLAFAKIVTGWDHVNPYRHLILESKNKTLLELRGEKMKELGM